MTLDRGVCELTVTIKGEDRTLREKNLIYDLFNVRDDDPIIKDCVARALKNFNGEPEKIRVKINLVIL